MANAPTVRLRLSGGSDYGIPDDRDTLAQLAPAILTHLGCSYEIAWPDEEDREARAVYRSRDCARANDEAEAYATAHTPPAGEAYVELVHELLAAAYRAGYNAAPKPMRMR